MRKVFVILAVMLLAVVPAFGQDEAAEPTIAEIVVASTTAETPEFTVLLAAVSAADPIFLEALSNPDANYTVFAPTDAAFAALLEELGLTAEEVLADTDLLNAVLAYHVVPGVFGADYFTAILGSGVESFVLGTLLPESVLSFAVVEESLNVNASNVVAADVTASNGVVHVIDAVLVPEMAAEEEEMMEGEEMAEPVSIAETVVAAAGAEAPEFTVLLAAVQAADPSILEELTNGGPFTVFAPTDAAFAALLEALGATAEEVLANTDLLNTVLAYHVVPGTISASTVVAAASGEGGLNVGTVYPGVLNIVAGEAGVTINETINVIATDVAVSNGVVHVIDGVLVPAME